MRNAFSENKTVRLLNVFRSLAVRDLPTFSINEIQIILCTLVAECAFKLCIPCKARRETLTGLRYGVDRQFWKQNQNGAGCSSMIVYACTINWNLARWNHRAAQNTSCSHNVVTGIERGGGGGERNAETSKSRAHVLRWCKRKVKKEGRKERRRAEETTATAGLRSVNLTAIRLLSKNTLMTRLSSAAASPFNFVCSSGFRLLYDRLLIVHRQSRTRRL